MNATAPAAQSSVSALPSSSSSGRRALRPGQAFLQGRVSGVRVSENGAVFTQIQTPAPDAYSHPGAHEVISPRRFGRPGDDVEIVVQLGGYPRKYRNKQGDEITTVDNVLRVVEE